MWCVSQSFPETQGVCVCVCVCVCKKEKDRQELTVRNWLSSLCRLADSNSAGLAGRLGSQGRPEVVTGG